MNHVVRFGILGAGKILAKLGPAFRLTTNARLVAIASRDRDRAEAAAREHGTPRAYAGYDALLADPDVDVVFNTLHNGLHCEWTCRALAAGKHVLCEKPLACSTAEVEQMFATAHQHRRWLMEAFMYRFHPQIAESLHRIRTGELGKLLHLRASYANRLNRELDNPRYRPDTGGGALMDIGCYCVNASRLFAGAEPQQVLAQARFSGDNGVDMTLAGALEFPGGLTAHVLCSFESEGVFGVEIVGSRAKIIIPNPWLPPGNFAEFQLIRNERAETIRIETPHQFSHFAAEIEHFADCVRENHAPLVVTETDSRANMRVIEALHESARRGTTVAVI